MSETIEEWEILDLLAALVDKSLVIYEEDEHGVGRYRLLLTIQQYAQEKLLESGEADPFRARHRDWFLALVEEARPNLLGPQQKTWLDRLDVEHDNLRVALQSCLDSESVQRGLWMGGVLKRFWFTRGHLSEGRKQLEELMSASETSAPTTARAEALDAAGYLARAQGDFAAAWAFYEESLAIGRAIGDQQSIATALNGLGTIAYRHNDAAAARGFYEESLLLWRTLGDQDHIAFVLNNLSLLYTQMGDYTTARAVGEEALSINRRLGNRDSIAFNLGTLGILAMEQRDWQAAYSLLDECVTLFREIGNRYGVANNLVNLGRAAHHQGDGAAARRSLTECLVLCRELQSKSIVEWAFSNLAAVSVAEGRMQQAACLFGAAEVLREIMGASTPPNDEGDISAARTALGEEAFAAAWAEGRKMTMEEAIEFAIRQSTRMDANSKSYSRPFA
jgi:tetratricopeptide (TPR) repeat protein